MTAENVNTLILAFVIVVGIVVIGQYATVKLFVTGKAAWFERRDEPDVDQKVVRLRGER